MSHSSVLHSPARLLRLALLGSLLMGLAASAIQRADVAYAAPG